MIRKTQVNSLKKLKTTIDGKRKTVYDILTSKGSATNRMIAKALGWDINRVTGRVTELVNLGMVTADGTTYDSDTNRTVTLWKVL
jgi:Mn-dependent DtxR family transcriptional regulator